MLVTDASSALLNWLQTNSDAAALRALVYDDEILENGDLTPTKLDSQFTARGNAAQVLVVTVREGPEQKTPEGWVSAVEVRAFDRHRGYRNLRSWRDRLLTDIDEHMERTALALTDINGRAQGLLFLEYAQRTGHLHSREFDCDFESITFTALRLIEER